MEKLCTGCGQSKIYTEFHKCKATSDGLQYKCKSCSAEATKQSRAIKRLKDPGHEKNVKKLWYQKNREVSIARAKVYRENHPEWAKEMNKKHSQIWRQRYPEKAKILASKQSRSRTLRGHDLTEDSYHAIKTQQQSRCAICGVIPDDNYGGFHDGFHIDHCHVSGRVRGLLCKHCNVGIGMLKDSEEVLQKAIEYLHRSRQNL